MEKGLREATVQGRVGAYTVMYELRQMAVACSRANVKLEVPFDIYFGTSQVLIIVRRHCSRQIQL